MVIKNQEPNLPQLADLKRLSDHGLTKAATADLVCGAFDLEQGLNPLISAAAPVITAALSLKQPLTQANATFLYDAFIREIKTFEKKTRALEYRSAVSLAGRYFLCSFVDEIALTQESLQQLWSKKPLLKSIQDESWGGERFFLILERASDDPKVHMDLLELGFFLLHLGYQGKYTQSPQTELENIKDNLYHLIASQRKNLHPNLFIHAETETKALLPRKKKFNVPHLLLAASILVLGTLGVYLPTLSHLNNLVKSNLTTLNTLASQPTQLDAYHG